MSGKKICKCIYFGTKDTNLYAWAFNLPRYAFSIFVKSLIRAYLSNTKITWYGGDETHLPSGGYMRKITIEDSETDIINFFSCIEPYNISNTIKTLLLDCKYKRPYSIKLLKRQTAQINKNKGKTRKETSKPIADITLQETSQKNPPNKTGHKIISNNNLTDDQKLEIIKKSLFAVGDKMNQ